MSIHLKIANYNEEDIFKTYKDLYDQDIQLGSTSLGPHRDGL